MSDTLSVLEAALVESFAEGANFAKEDVLSQGLVTIIDSLPEMGSSPLLDSYRSTLVNILVTSLPNSAIVPPPAAELAVYAYSGAYSGYQEAFYGSASKSSLAGSTQSAIVAVVPALDSGWWERFSIAVLTQAIQGSVGSVGAALDSDAITNDVESYNGALQPALATGYGVVFAQLSPGVSSLVSGGGASTALSTLEAAITSGVFTAAVLGSLADGGDSAAETAWFIFNLWILLAALGAVDVDGQISSFVAAGLPVPAEVAAGNWRTNYVSWFAALSAGDVTSLASATLQASMPVTTVMMDSFSQPITQLPFGYSSSFALWSPYNSYYAG